MMSLVRRSINQNCCPQTNSYVVMPSDKVTRAAVERSGMSFLTT